MAGSTARKWISDGAGTLRPVEAGLAGLSAALSWAAFGPVGLGVTAGVLLTAAAALAALRLARARNPEGAAQPGPLGDPLRAQAISSAEAALREAEAAGHGTACLVVALHDAGEIAGRIGRAGAEASVERCAERIAAALRDGDRVLRLTDARIAVVLRPQRRADLESVIQIAARLLAAVSEPVSVDAVSVYVGASCGFCLSARAPARSGEALFTAAEEAAEAALRGGPGAVRAWSADIAQAARDRSSLRDAVAEALDGGEFVAHFQPQLSTDTGAVAGFELLARWAHPRRGLLGPDEFLSAVTDAGLSARLGEVMLFSALTALRSWDRAGLRVPRVAVNLSRDELRDPRIAERIKWELDRFEIAPARLTIEVLESVAADAGDDIVVRNVAALAALGCRIDLDDFGTGHASIAQLRRFRVHRIKIDRSFVTRVDTDADQRRMVSAILSMAEQLGLETVAEGVESLGEHAILAQLGCTAVQGFAIARPMPFDETHAWLDRHAAKLDSAPRIDRRAI